jgi:hypothetical protein
MRSVHGTKMEGQYLNKGLFFFCEFMKRPHTTNPFNQMPNTNQLEDSLWIPSNQIQRRVNPVQPVRFCDLPDAIPAAAHS